jgi:hypothetical protein
VYISFLTKFSVLVLVKLRNSSIDYLCKLKIDYTIKLHHSSKTENLSTFIKSLKMKRSHDARDVQKIWSSSDCNNDPNIEFYCNGRLPVFNEWITENAKQVIRNTKVKFSLLTFFCLIVFSNSLVN